MCAAIPSENTKFVLCVSLEETASQESKKDEDDRGFDSMCDSKGSTHSGKNYLKTFSFLRKCLKTSLGWLFLAEYRDGFIGLYHTSWSTISCTQFQNSQFPLAVASKNGPLYLCVDYELSLFVSFYCCSRKWLLLFILSSLLELITEYLSTLSDTPVKYSSSHTSFFLNFSKIQTAFLTIL